MRIIPGFMIREIAGETIAIPSGEAAHQLSGLIALNGSGRFLFELLQTEHTEEDLVCALMEEYEVDREVASADVTEFLTQLRTGGMLTD